jgi:cell division protein FtsA
MVLESLALSQTILSENEMEVGVVAIDIGGDITNISVFYEGAIRHTAVVPLGSRNVTNDIAIGLRSSVEQAEELKLTCGAALASTVDAEEMISVPGVAGRSPREISRNVLASIIEPRMEEILSLAGREVNKVARTDGFTAGIVLSGGGSQMAGTLELAEQMFDMPVRVGQIDNIRHTPDDLKFPSFATAHGLIVYGFQNEPAEGSRKGNIRGLFKRLENWIAKQF